MPQDEWGNVRRRGLIRGGGGGVLISGFSLDLWVDIKLIAGFSVAY